MTKTIDVGDPDGPKWPPHPPRRRGGGGGSQRPFQNLPLAARAAAIALAVIVLMAVYLGSTGRLGVTQVQANEVAVRVNYLTGGTSVITQPGYQFYLPYVVEIHKIDRTTQEYVMRGNAYDGFNRAPRLTVRANDGSNFWFDELKIQYEIIPGQADLVLSDSGPNDTFKQEWIKAHARSILRDEFGRYSAVEVANPTIYKQAPEEARQLMNAILEDAAGENGHGIRVVRIITPNPSFDPKYENAIETRKEADQEVEELKARVDQLEQVREQRLAAVRKEKEVEMQELVGELERLRLGAERDAIQRTKSADAYSVERRSEGEALKVERLAEATGLEAKYRKEAEGIASRAKALEEKGEVVVREALVQKLLGVEFTFVPYSRDPAPQRLEHSGNRDTVDPRVLEGSNR